MCESAMSCARTPTSEWVRLECRILDLHFASAAVITKVRRVGFICTPGIERGASTRMAASRVYSCSLAEKCDALDVAALRTTCRNQAVFNFRSCGSGRHLLPRLCSQCCLLVGRARFIMRK